MTLPTLCACCRAREVPEHRSVCYHCYPEIGADQLEERIAAAVAKCREYSHPGCEPGKHQLALDVLKILEGESK